LASSAASLGYPVSFVPSGNVTVTVESRESAIVVPEATVIHTGDGLVDVWFGPRAFDVT
jgi:hypothetical protein